MSEYISKGSECLRRDSDSEGYGRTSRGVEEHHHGLVTGSVG